MKPFPLVRSVLALALTLTMAGCNASPTALVPKPPHGGSLFTAPDGKKVVEIVRQDASSPGKVQFVAFFLDDQLKPLAALPTAASFKPKDPRDAPTMELKPTGDADPALASGMACPPIDDKGGIVGQLTTTIDGQPVVFPVNAR